MKPPRLANLYDRAPFGFERELIGRKHVGWVCFVGEKACRLTLNPWMNGEGFRDLYILPEEFNLANGEFVELSVGESRPLVRTFQKGTTLARDFDYVHNVEGVIRFSSPPFIKPRLTKRDFLYRLTEGWKFPEEDQLDMTIGLQTISCPARTVSIGGLGSETFQSQNLKGPIEGVQKTLRSILPPDLLAPNPRFIFQLVRTGKDYDRAMSNVNNPISSELSYNYTPALRSISKPLRMNFPTVITNARYNGRGTEWDIDFYEYMLSAQMFDPTLTDDVRGKVIDYIGELRTEFLPGFRKFNIALDPHTITRVALALARLELKNEVDSSLMLRAWKLCSDLYKDYVLYLEDTYDAPGTPSSRTDRVLTWYEDLTRDESSTYESLIDLTDSTKKAVPIAQLHERLDAKLNPARVDKAVRGLSSKGRLIFSKDNLSVQPIE